MPEDKLPKFTQGLLAARRKTLIGKNIIEPVYVVDVCYLYVWRLAARKLFFICLYNEELFYVQEDEMEYALYTE